LCRFATQRIQQSVDTDHHGCDHYESGFRAFGLSSRWALMWENSLSSCMTVDSIVRGTPPHYQPVILRFVASNFIFSVGHDVIDVVVIVPLANSDSDSQ
jgi:hypothetical protein